MDATDRYILGEVAIQGLMDRRGLREPLQGIKYDDPQIWDEILQEMGDAIAKHLADSK
jgi:hypothetical protein